MSAGFLVIAHNHIEYICNVLYMFEATRIRLEGPQFVANFYVKIEERFFQCHSLFILKNITIKQLKYSFLHEIMKHKKEKFSEAINI